MKLTSQQAFNSYAAEVRGRWEQRFQGSGWTFSVGISECSKAKGALDTLANLEFNLDRSGLDYELRRVGCAGWCFAEPFVEVSPPDGPAIIYGNVDTDSVPALVEALKRGDFPTENAMGVRADSSYHGINPLHEHPFLKGQRRVLLENSGVIDPESIDDYIANGGYSAWTKVLFDMSPEEVVRGQGIERPRSWRCRLSGWYQVGERAPDSGVAEVRGGKQSRGRAKRLQRPAPH
jgi:NADH-quinone oxidoreductase subunit F